MKRIVLALIIALVGYIQAASAQEDTVGFWKVEYNGKEIAPVTLNSEQSYFFSTMNDTDKVDIFYFNESPCKKCLCKLEMRDDSSIVWKTIPRKGYGDSRPFLLTGKELNPELAKGRVYMYFIIQYDGWEPPIFMGSLRLSK